MKLNHKQIIVLAIESAIANLQKHVEEINNLNVFPVPDGDTGSNMISTLTSGFDNISDESETDKEVLLEFAKGCLYGARGNSGVITSQIIRGVSNGLGEVGAFSSSDINNMRTILRHVRETAYKAVSKPVEGTILSVIKAIDANVNRDSNNIVELFIDLLGITIAAVENTPNQLQILKDANVVDSGAKGLYYLIEGVLFALQGKPLQLKLNETTQEIKIKKETIGKADPNRNIGYCTEFILSLKDPENFDTNLFKNFLIKNGSSLVYIPDEDILKVHVHSKKPGNILSEAHKYGEFSKLKIENMTLQVDENDIIDENNSFIALNNNELGIIATSSGVGLTNEFKELGVDYVISSPKNVNTSVSEFVEAIDSLPNKNILILPNNSNVILAAEEAKKMIKEKNIFIVKTKSFMQGLFIAENINKEMVNFEEYEENINEEIDSIIDGKITKANRNTEIKGVKIEENDYIAFNGKELISVKQNLMDTFYDFIDKIILEDEDVENISVYYSKHIHEVERNAITSFFKDKYPNIDFKLKYGGQATYNILVLAS